MTLTTIKCSVLFASITVAIVLVLIVSQVCPNALAQTVTNFTSADRFNIPSHNGTVSFAVNGTYANATLENGTWTFADLRLNGSQPLEIFEVSTQDSNVTIFAHLSFDTLRRIALLAYFVEGQGTQTLNMGIESGKGESGASAEWSVLFNDVFVGEGDGWSIAPDGTLTVTGVTGNVTIIYFSIEDGSSANLPFHEQHSIVILTAVAVAITVTATVAVKVKNKKYLNQGEG